MPNAKTLYVKACAGKPLALAMWQGRCFDCLLGKNGVIFADEKREGDGKTPLGRFALVGGFYRADKVEKKGVCVRAISPDMGWCDAPGDVLYNRLCSVGYVASHEVLWREDEAYDYIGVLDYNLKGAVTADGRGLGSAIFLHVWRDGATHTEGCVALKKADLEAVLAAGCEAVEIVLD